MPRPVALTRSLGRICAGAVVALLVVSGTTVLTGAEAATDAATPGRGTAGQEGQEGQRRDAG